MIRWIIEAGYFLGSAAIILTIAGLIFAVANRWIGPDPVEPDPEPDPRRRTPPAPAPVVFDPGSPPANYTRGDQMHQWEAEAPTAVTEVLDFAEALTETIAKFVEPDPLDDTVELPVIDDIETPLYYQIRPPAPLHLEGHTDHWKRDELLARIRGEAK